GDPAHGVGPCPHREDAHARLRPRGRRGSHPHPRRRDGGRVEHPLLPPSGSLRRCMSTRPRYVWATAGDGSAFLGLMFDNVAQLIVFSTILIQVFAYPADLVLTRMLPGTAFGVLVGDLIYTWLAFRLAARTGRTDVTAMPLGIDTVSLFGLTFGALGPVYRKTGDAVLAWEVGMALMVLMGVFKIAMAWPAARLRRFVPAAAMLGTIGGIGVARIAVMPLLKIYAPPAVGVVALFLVLVVLLRPPRLPGDLPPVLFAVALATALYYGLRFEGVLAGESELGAVSGLGF